MTQGENTGWLKCPSCKSVGVRVLGDNEHRLQCLQCGFVWRAKPTAATNVGFTGHPPSVIIKPAKPKE